MARQDDPKDTYRRIIGAITAGDSEALLALLSPDLLDHNPVAGQAWGRAGFIEWMSSARKAFPDLEGTVQDMLREGKRVAGRVVWRGTHRGAFAGVAPTGKPVSFSAIHIVRFSRGRAIEWWGAGDLLGALQQIGATISGPNEARGHGASCIDRGSSGQPSLKRAPRSG